MSAGQRPRVVVSRCLDLQACRFDGQAIRAPFVRRLGAYVDLEPVCPEVEIGLGVPRDTLRLVELGGGSRLVQPATGRDLTASMLRFARTSTTELGDVDGFILKSRSPSCGVKGVKVYARPEASPAVRHGPGLYAKVVLDRFPKAAIEDEGRLTSFRIRHHFLIKVFASCKLRQVESRRDLVAFHTAHKLLWMTYSQAGLRRLGRLVANTERRLLAASLEAYGREMAKLLARPARRVAHVNVLMHALGYVSKGLSPSEKNQFLETLLEYRHERLPLAAPLTLMHSWVRRFGTDYLAGQSYFEPYPKALMDLRDSGGRSAAI